MRPLCHTALAPYRFSLSSGPQRQWALSAFQISTVLLRPVSPPPSAQNSSSTVTQAAYSRGCCIEGARVHSPPGCQNSTSLSTPLVLLLPPATMRPPPITLAARPDRDSSIEGIICHPRFSPCQASRSSRSTELWRCSPCRPPSAKSVPRVGPETTATSALGCSIGGSLHRQRELCSSPVSEQTTSAEISQPAASPCWSTGSCLFQLEL
mmetsp:Transcript_17457/g.41447  ORF Transcript_17457/g.41447 Transcript_17457/m.41447 type:complete len:209 (+) Transcript_17457:434-1060(+)